MSKYYWQCDTCHIESAFLWSMDEARSDYAHHSGQHHGHLVAFVNDSSDTDGTTYYWQCDDCHVHSHYKFESMDEARADRSYHPAHSHHQIALVVDAS